MSVLLKSSLIGIVIGLLWFLVQFICSEIFYQIAYHELTDPVIQADTFHDISDTIAFPAAEIYDQVDMFIIQSELLKLQQRDSLDTAERDKVTTLLGRFASSEDFDTLQDDSYDILDGYQIHPEVPVFLEYMIYAGICLMWGTLIGLISGVVAYFLYAKANSKTEAVSS